MKCNTLNVKKIGAIILCFVCWSLSSCSNNGRNEEKKNAINNKVEIQGKVDSLNLEIKIQKARNDIEGTYFVTKFSSQKIELLKNFPANDGAYFTIYKFIFKDDGTIEFKDLTKFYGCGNGVLSISNSTWGVNQQGKYILQFEQNYFGMKRFEFVAEYSLNVVSGDCKELVMSQFISEKELDLF